MKLTDSLMSTVMSRVTEFKKITDVLLLLVNGVNFSWFAN